MKSDFKGIPDDDKQLVAHLVAAGSTPAHIRDVVARAKARIYSLRTIQRLAASFRQN